MTARTTKTTRATAKATVAPETVEFIESTDTHGINDAEAMLRAAQENYMAKLGIASPKRWIISLVLTAVAVAGLGLILGALTNILVGAAFAFTGSIFFAWVVQIFCWVAAFVVGWKAGTTMFGYLIGDEVTAHVGAAKSVFSRAFGRNDPQAA